MSDRQKIIDKSGGNLNVCQVGCTLKAFNNTSKKVKCDCDLKSTKHVTNLNDIEFNPHLIINLFGEVKYSNYLVLKCYKLLLDSKLLQKNIGFIVMTIIFIALILLFIIYILKGRKKIDYYIKAVLNNKSIYIQNRKISTKKNSFIKKSQKKMKNKKQLTKSKTFNFRRKKSKKSVIEKNNNVPPIKKTVNKKDNSNTNSNLNKDDGSSSALKNCTKDDQDVNKQNDFKNVNINMIQIQNLNYKRSKKGKKLFKNKNNNNNNNNSNLDNDATIYQLKKKVSKERRLNTIENKNQKLKLDYINYQTLNIHELNTLEYDIAIIVDKRTYFQYYCSLIRKKHLIIFTFVPIDDYNLVSLKISLFLLSFSLYMAVNALFFTDYTMHQIYVNNGMDFLEHLPIIIYSSLISTVVNTLLKQLCLSENDILSIKKSRYMRVSIKRAKEVKSNLIIKFSFYFIVSFILCLLFWYFISCFCAVYTNTQIILIKDTLISFGISMLYPFGIYLIPGLFRIPSLRAKNKDKLGIYKISQLLALI